MNGARRTQLFSGSPALTFFHLRWSLLRNAVGSLEFSSWMRVLSIGILTIFIWCFVFVLCWKGFFLLPNELESLIQGNQPRAAPSTVPTTTVIDIMALMQKIIETAFNLLFLALAVMLISSGGIILYSSMYAAPETAFLLSSPAPADQVFAYKFQGALAFSSWAFVLLGSPVLIAYGIVFHAPWHFYVLLPLFTIGFILLPGSLGALLCMLIVYFIPRRRKTIMGLAVGAAAVLVILGGWWLIRSLRYPDDGKGAATRISEVLQEFSFAGGRLLPTNWMTRGLVSSRANNLSEALYCLALLWSNGLFLYLLTGWTARLIYRSGYNRVATGGDLRRKYGGTWIDRPFQRVLSFLDVQTRLLIIKDLRTFRRDPAQWAQILIFAGLLILYFTNTHRFAREDIGRRFQNFTNLMNLGSTSLLLCAYTCRFIFPMLSLEGRMFWMLGLLPLDRNRIMWGKFGFSAVGALVMAEVLVMISDFSMSMPPLVIGLHALTMAVIALGLSGISVGLGATLPNFRESDPSKIAVGFGGTLNLIASVLFVLLVVGLMTGPWHFYAVVHKDLPLTEIVADGWLIGGVVAGCLIGVLAVIVPLRLGMLSLRQMEF